MKWVVSISLFLFLIMSLNRVNAQTNNTVVSSDFLNEKAKKILDSISSAEKYLSIRIFPEFLFPDSLKTNFISRSDIAGLISVVVINLEEGIKIVNRQEVNHWGLSGDEIFQKAKNSTFKYIEDLTFEKIKLTEKANCFVSWDEENYFVSSLLHFPDTFSKYDKKKLGIIVGLPTRHIFSVMPVESEPTLLDDLETYYYFLAEINRNEPSPLTLNMYLYKSGNFHLISPVFNSNGEPTTFIIR